MRTLLAVVIVLAAFPASVGASTPGPGRAREYWFDQWHVAQLWGSGARGQGITIAEIDTGVNARLPELRGRILPGIDLGPTGGDGRTDRDRDEFGHGTAMASIAVGRRGSLGVMGLAPGARVLPVAVPLRGTTDASADDRLPEAIRWSADHDAKIISMALGEARAQPCLADEQAAIRYALGKGSVLFASSGNRGRSDSASEAPGACRGVVSVGAVDRFGRVAGFSSRHLYLTMSAPGVDVASLGRVPGSVYSGDGTSQATTIAAAVGALVWSKHPGMSGKQLIARMLATLDARRRTHDPAYGYGTVNAYRAVTAGDDAPTHPSSPGAPLLAAGLLAVVALVLLRSRRAPTRASALPG